LNDIARRSSARGRQTTVRWQKQVFIHTQLSRAYLALARLSCLHIHCMIYGVVLTNHNILNRIQCLPDYDRFGRN